MLEHERSLVRAFVAREQAGTQRCPDQLLLPSDRQSLRIGGKVLDWKLARLKRLRAQAQEPELRAAIACKLATMTDQCSARGTLQQKRLSLSRCDAGTERRHCGRCTAQGTDAARSRSHQRASRPASHRQPTRRRTGLPSASRFDCEYPRTPPWARRNIRGGGGGGARRHTAKLPQGCRCTFPACSKCGA